MSTEKFKVLVHFIIDACGDPARLGAVRLNKICWYSDVIAYKETGAPITGERYVKRQMGPVPASILPTIRSLQDAGLIAVSERDFGSHRRRDFMSLKPANTALLSEVEMAIIRSVLSDICDGHSANSISDLTHDQVWEAASMGEIIPLFATLASTPGEIDQSSEEWADSMVQELQEKKVAA